MDALIHLIIATSVFFTLFILTQNFCPVNATSMHSLHFAHYMYIVHCGKQFELWLFSAIGVQPACSALSKELKCTIGAKT